MSGLAALQVDQAGKPGAKLGAGKHHDEHGLYLEIRSTTPKSWTGRHAISGKVRWIGIGPVTDITLKRARELHAENRRLAEGIDPIEHREAAGCRGDRSGQSGHLQGNGGPVHRLT